MADVDLSEYVDSLKREVVPPGSTLFADVTDAQWVSYLADAFWEAKLDGFFGDYSCDSDGYVTHADLTTLFPREGVQLTVLYAGVRVLRNKVLNTNTVFRAKAGEVEYEQQFGATMLSEMLKQLKGQKEALLAKAEAVGTDVALYDALSVRSFSDVSYYGSIELT